jgi:hypothetical protein
MNGLVAGLHERFRDARRAPTTTSIEDDFRIFGKLVHALFRLRNRDVDRSRNYSAFLELGCFADVDNDEFLMSLDLLLEFRNRYAFSSHRLMIQFSFVAVHGGVALRVPHDHVHDK